MNDNEVNKIIAEYMGMQVSQFYDRGNYVFKRNSIEMYPLYTTSLDALVPVWGKLGIREHLALSFNPIEVFVWEEGNYTSGWESFNSKGSTIQQAAAHATAKAIKELV